jgi:hypothetical protein
LSSATRELFVKVCRTDAALTGSAGTTVQHNRCL